MDQATFMAATGAPQASAAFWLGPVTAAMDRFQINTPARQAAFLAQIGYESGGFPLPPVSEKFNYAAARLDAVFSSLSQAQCNALGRQPGENCVPPDRQQQIANLVYQNKGGNGPASSGDGWRYRGSGLIQLTFKDNFAAVGRGIGMDLVSNPDSVRNDPDTAALAAAWFWQSRGCNELADQGKFHEITAKINPAHAGEQGRDNAYELASNALGADVAGGSAIT
ncbi:glycoside hydrolase family protein [Caballeronia calidae]|uniref:Glycoside hydrolase family protein n=1 Tax=Caballeronia calidae TaxID=1777139 RepID=A0A158AYY0_9BURK|nr:glycoside hydrolase family 19 protein [Caballeronia calidae]SAK62943.1 glycoside hydrolase family protein [Caballeronia calidae]